MNRTGEMLKEIFDSAHRLGIKTCVGTESPLSIPEAIKSRLKELGMKQDDPAVLQKLYEGMFLRIQRLSDRLLLDLGTRGRDRPESIPLECAMRVGGGQRDEGAVRDGYLRLGLDHLELSPAGQGVANECGIQRHQHDRGQGSRIAQFRQAGYASSMGDSVAGR